MNHTGCRQLIGVLGALGALSVGVAACGGSDSSTSSTKDQSGSTGAARSSAAEADLAALQASVDRFKKPPTQIAVTEPIKNPARGKTAAVIVLNAPTSRAAADGTTAAAKLLGWKVTQIKADQTPASVNTAWTRAAQIKPDVVFAAAFPASVYQKQADELRAHGTKLLGYAMGSDTNPAKDYDWSTQSNSALGEWMKLAASQIAIESKGGGAQVASFWMETYPTDQAMEKAFGEQLTASCPTCKNDRQVLNPADIGTKFPGQVVSYLQRHPDTDYLVFSYSPQLTGVEAAIKAAGVGTNLKGVLTEAGEKPQWDLMSPDGMVSFDLTKNTTELGWQMFDAALRLESGQPAPGGVPKFDAPIFIVTRDNITSFRDSGYQFNTDYQEQYKKLWGLAG